ncbi:T9SS-dependent choice-of-anchor J family protein [Flaviaesturariibacter amylovorans]|uniref:T9SS type A sorting domain-containing protein n=1 Tax=Flaviaesturariibacter amylovorans TaxID=1084520 RepID=A0ABP8GIT9_9BACT
MKNFTLLFLGLSLMGITMAHAQKKEPSAATVHRCGTMEAIEERLQHDAAFRAQWEAKQREAARTRPTSGRTARISNLTAPVNIPVIVHVVLPNPSFITEAHVDALLNQLNLDFSGLNPDSTNGAPFYNVRGHSQIRFVRARRDPSGNLTNGIQRRVGNPGIAGATYQRIKHFSEGGLDPWDVTKYYNIWVGDSGPSGLLGIAPGIGVGGQTETPASSTGIDGVCVDYRGFSNGCYSFPQFARGRTVVHEIGHNFGLYHTFQGGCNSQDFNQLTPAGQTLPATMLAAGDDTPSQSNATSGCPTGTPASGCAGVATRMYQNYMDYTDDNCYSMFTNGQVARMEYVLENFRPGYLTTNGATPPSNVPALDITPNVLVSPGGSEFNNATCSSVAYPTPNCPTGIVPRVQVRNQGSTTITSLTVSVSVNGGTPVTSTVTGLNILTGYSATVALPSVNLVEGTNTLTFTTSAPNGGTDEVASNNTFTTTITIAAPIALPLEEGFESTTFPTSNWTLSNPDGDVTWVRRAPGRNSGFSAFFDNWNNDVVGTKDDIRSVPIAVANKAVSITFDLAHKNYGTASADWDTLQVLVSTDCGVTFTSLYKKWGTNLATAGAATANYTNPIASDWRRDTVTVPATLLTSGKMIVAFRNSNRYGNNIFLDNIRIVTIENRDIQAFSLNTTAPFVCASPGATSLTVKNTGAEAVTGFKIGYSVNNGATVTQTVTGINLPKDSFITVPITNIALTAGSNALRVFTFDPVSASGTGDFANANDTARTVLTLSTQVPDGLNENFSALTALPPTGWAVGNYDNAATWAYSPYGNGNAGSAWIRSFNYTGSNRDDLATPVVTYSGVDSIILSFDVAAASRYYPGTTNIQLDTLEVLATTNCGASYDVLYKKWGSALQSTANQSNQNFPLNTEFTPLTAFNSFRNERIDASRYINNPSVQFVFRARTNNGNNIYIDNVNVTTKKLPANLKQNGYVVTPNPTTGRFRIWHVQPPTTLRFVNVYDSKGALVWSRSFTKNAENVIYVDLSGQPAGVYMVSLNYDDEHRNVTERVIKR